MARVKKILIGGVPYGYGNLGDEAILACIVEGCKQVCPKAEITVLTGKPSETEERLKVRAVPLRLRDGPGEFAWSRKLLHAFWENDLFILGGANGLSECPQMPLKMICMAKLLGKKVMLYGVGLDSVRYRFLPNRPWKRRLCRAADTLLGRPGRFQSLYEYARTGLIRSCLRLVCNRVDLISVRDAESAALLREYGVQTPPLHVTADPALLLDWADNRPAVALAPVERKGHLIIGVGISAEQAPPPPVQKAIAQVLDYLVQKYRVRILFIPINPYIDPVTMGEIRDGMEERHEADILMGQFTPEKLLRILRRTDLIISSRLHLLLMAFVCNVPCVGLSRGPEMKIDKFLHRLGLEAVGDVREIDAARLRQACEQTWLDRNRIRDPMRALLCDMQQVARKNQFLLGALVHGSG
jgi:polysaccharide pyruvyl transferase WcaK-like protein